MLRKAPILTTCSAEEQSKAKVTTLVNTAPGNLCRKKNRAQLVETVCYRNNNDAKIVSKSVQPKLSSDHRVKNAVKTLLSSAILTNQVNPLDRMCREAKNCCKSCSFKQPILLELTDVRMLLP